MDWILLVLKFTFTAAPLLLAALAAVSGVWLAIALGSSVVAGLWLVAGAFLIETLFVAAPSVPLGIQFSTNDAAVMLLVGGLIFRYLFVGLPARSRELTVWCGLGAMVVLALVSGLAVFGTKAGVEARANFYFVMMGLYFASFRYTQAELERMWRIVLWCAWAVALVVAYRWVGLKLGFVSTQLVEAAGASSEFRVVGSNPTFFLAMVGCAYAANWLRTSQPRSLVGALALLSLVVLLQHRSVWVATLGALFVIGWLNRSDLRGKAFPIIALCAVGIVSAVFFAAINPESRLVETLTRSATSVAEARGTHVERYVGWIELLRGYANGGPKVWLLGEPFGSGYERWVLGRLKDFSPHNFYVQLLLRVGAIGLLLFVSAHVLIQRRVLKGEILNFPVGGLPRQVLLAALGASLLYYIPYQGFYLHGVLYGVLIGALAPARQGGQAVPYSGWQARRAGVAP